MDGGKKRRKPNPRKGASWFSIITFSWLFETYFTGFRRGLNLSDLYHPLDEHASHYVGNMLMAEWKQEQRRCEDFNRPPNLMKVLFRCFGRDIMTSGVVQAILEFILRLSRPFILLQLLHYLSERFEMAKIEAFGWSAVLMLGVFMESLVNHLCLNNLMHVGMKIKIACSSLLYRKILNIPVNFKESKTNVGQVLNLLSNDVSKLDKVIYHIHYIWISPLQALLIFYFLYREVHLAAISGILIQILFLPILGIFGKLSNRLTSKYTVRTDERLRLTNEIIKGVRVIKMYVWEKPFSFLVNAARKKEVHFLKKKSIITDISLASELYIPKICVFVTILSYVLRGNDVNAEKIYVVMALYDVLRMSMYTLLPLCLDDISEALISLKRVERFLSIKELPALAKNLNAFEKNDKISSKEPVITFKDFSAQWSFKRDVLININIEIHSRCLTAIVGQVGSGKTSLLYAILNEIPNSYGISMTHGKISYASQEAWIFSSSIKQNILFGNPYDESRYKQVLKICQLNKDLEEFAYGDATVIGEKGINLSGGQCARINLARAIYDDSDIYLLDDPLSAVDSVVGRKIFDECILEFLGEKTTVLVTHQFQYLQDGIDTIVVMDNGRIEAVGSFEELRKKGINLMQMIQTSDESNEEKNTIKNFRESVADCNITNSIIEEQQTEENKIEGNISLKTYLSYFKASNSMPLVILVIFTSLMYQTCASGGDYFLAYWVNEEEKNTRFDNLTCNKHVCTDRKWYIYIYGGLTTATIALCFLQSLSFFEMSMRIANNLHVNMLTSVISTTIEFFSINTLGRIMNRFSKDISIVDTEISRAMIEVIQNAIHIVATFCIVSSVNEWFFILTVMAGLVFYVSSYFCVKISRSIKRLEGLTRSPLFNHISDSLQGLTTIRALRAKTILVSEFNDHQDLHSSAWFLSFSGSRAFGMYFDIFCASFLSFVLLTLLAFNSNTLPGDVGLAVTQCMILINTLRWGIRQFAELDNQMTSVERVLEYSKLPNESDTINKSLNSITERRKRKSKKSLPINKKFDPFQVPTDWPTNGRIEFRNVTLKYTRKGPVILKDLTFLINSKEKVGIVGRTGAGKTSIINALFRLGHVNGEIYIDGLLINELALNDLRPKISIIPQDPMLFEGSLRKNLDPSNEYTNAKLWQALSDVGMKRGLNDLQMPVSEGGFSVGQRQLLCIARAIVRSSRILILDEATANVDPRTDELIQKTIKKKFEGCTIITIAHRLHTVIDSDRIIAMESGAILEFDSPYILLTAKKGLLYDIVQQTGPASSKMLINIAKLNYEKKLQQKQTLI